MSANERVPRASRRSRGRNGLGILAASCLFAATCIATVDASANGDPSLEELREDRREVRSDKVRAASDVDALGASSVELSEALQVLADDIVSTGARLDDARREAERAEAEQSAADERAARAEEELADLRDEIKAQAVAAYVSSPPDEFLQLLSADSLTDLAQRQTLLEANTLGDLDAAERYRAVREDLRTAQDEADSARSRAEERRDDVSTELAELETARQRRAELAESVETRLDRALGEAASLRELDADLAESITSRETALAASLRTQTEKVEAQVGSGDGSSSTGGAEASRGTPRQPASTGPAPTAAPAPPTTSRPVPRPAPRPAPPTTSRPAPRPAQPTTAFPSSGIVNVQGIRVDASIASQLNRLLSAARSAGVALSGGGYRDPAGQIAVRRANCGSSNYAIYQMPSSSCRPPTARPGSSMHERGLAIDFTQGGRVLTRSSSGYRWLVANASRYGLANLPSEPWHWSTNGN